MANKSPINLSSNWILTHGNSLYNCSTTEINTTINNNGSATAGSSSSASGTTSTTPQQPTSSKNDSKTLDNLISLDRAIALKQPIFFESENDFLQSKNIPKISNNNNNTTNNNNNGTATSKSAKYCDFFIKCDKENKIHEIRLVCDCEKIEIFTGEMEEYYRLCYGKSLLDDPTATDDEQTKAYIFNITMAFNVVNCIRIKFIQPQVIWIYSLNTILSNLIKPPSMYKSMNNKIDFDNVDAYLANCSLSEKAKNFHDFMKASSVGASSGNSQFSNLENAKAFFLQATLAGRGLNLPSMPYQQHSPYSFPGQHHSIPSQPQQQQQQHQQQQHYQKQYHPYQTAQPPKKENHNKSEDESVITIELKSYFDKRLMEIEKNLSDRIDEKLYGFEQRQIERFDKILSSINKLKNNAMKENPPENIDEKLQE